MKPSIWENSCGEVRQKVSPQFSLCPYAGAVFSRRHGMTRGNIILHKIVTAFDTKGESAP